MWEIVWRMNYSSHSESEKRIWVVWVRNFWETARENRCREIAWVAFAEVKIWEDRSSYWKMKTEVASRYLYLSEKRYQKWKGTLKQCDANLAENLVLHLDSTLKHHATNGRRESNLTHTPTLKLQFARGRYRPTWARVVEGVNLPCTSRLIVPETATFAENERVHAISSR